MEFTEPLTSIYRSVFFYFLEFFFLFYKDFIESLHQLCKQKMFLIQSETNKIENKFLFYFVLDIQKTTSDR